MEGSFLANVSNGTLGRAGRPPFSYYSLAITIILLAPLLLFNILLTVAIAMEKSLAWTQRLVLVNIVTAGQIVILGLIMFFTANTIISGCWCPELRPSDFACRWIYWVIASGGAARLVYMAMFAISVYVLVRYGARKMSTWASVIATIGAWVVVLLPNAAIFSPDIVLITFNDNVTCAAHGTGYKTFIYAFGYAGAYGIMGFAMSVFSLIATVCFIRRNSISGDIALEKAMMKFALFLILGNIINFVGQVIPLQFAAFAPAGKDWYDLEKVLNYVEGVFILLSLIPTPVLILIYFRPVRQRVTRVLCSLCLCLKRLPRRRVRSSTDSAVIRLSDNTHIINVGESLWNTKGL